MLTGPSAAAAEAAADGVSKDSLKSIAACRKLVKVRKIAESRDQRFLGKVAESTAMCRGGEHPVKYHDEPWARLARLLGDR